MQMNNAINRLESHIRCVVVILFTGLFAAAPGLCQQTKSSGDPSAATVDLPEAPRPMPEPSAADAAYPGPPELALAAGAQDPGASQPGNSQPSAAQQQANPQKPVGTAAAPPQSTVGYTASRPAGAVIAPAKQRRTRAILIRTALIVGAGVAIGTVLLLTHATPSQPPQ
jgi:hypothetical protein